MNATDSLLKDEIRESSDFALLDEYLAATIGLRLWKARLSYGDELKLLIGEPEPISNPKFECIRRADYVLATRASAWRADVKRSGPAVAGASPEQLADYVNQLAGTKVASAHTSRWNLPEDLPPGLHILFEDGSVFDLVPLPSTDPIEDDIADWELFTPFKTFIRVGPGPVWSNLRSDVAIVPNGKPAVPAG
jgi:hypothetical protein